MINISVNVFRHKWYQWIPLNALISRVFLLFILIQFMNSSEALEVIYKSRTLLRQVKLFGTLVIIPRTKGWRFAATLLTIIIPHERRTF